MNYLKQRIDISCPKDFSRKKREDKERGKYGVNHNSYTWGMDGTLSAIIVNAFVSFINVGERNVCLPENNNFYEETYKCAMDIKKYRGIDSYDVNSESHKKLRRDFENAMKWLTDNFDNLWW